MQQCWSCGQSVMHSGPFCRACGVQIRWQRWQIVRLLGEGGNGTVYLVEDRQRQAVLKLPLPGVDLRQHQIECRNLYLAAALDVAPAPIETSPEGVVMAYLPTPSGMPLKERVRCFLGGLNRLHNQDLVHRDVKPENVIGFSLIDLGSMVDMIRDRDLRPIGTPGYVAPEAWCRAEVYQERVAPALDAYGAGWVIIDWLGGPEPDPSPTVMGYPTGWTPPRDPDVEWEMLLRGLLEPDPARRLSVGRAYTQVTGPWCMLPGGVAIASDLVTLAQWQSILPGAPAREMYGYATELAAHDVAAYLQATGTRLPSIDELKALSQGTERQSSLRPPERMLQEGRVSDMGARHCRRLLWQPTREGLLFGGTAYATQETIKATGPNPTVGLRVART